MTTLMKLLDSTTIRGYLELIDCDIRIEYKKLEDALSDYGILRPEGYYIEMDTSVKDAEDKVKIGLIASELSHIVQDTKLSLLGKLKDGILYKLSKRYRILDERNADIITIVRGFGNELYEAMKFAEEKGFPYYREDGLSLRELEILTKKKKLIS